MDFALIIQLLANAFLPMAILTLSSFAIILIFKTSTTTNFAQGMISTFGAYVTALFFAKYGVPIYFAIIIGIVFGFLVGVIVDYGIIRRAKIVTPVGKQMITMGIVLIFLGIIPLFVSFAGDIYVPPIIEGSVRLFYDEGRGYHRVIISNHSLLGLGVSLVILASLFLALKFTRWGLAVRATANNERVASLMGINTKMITAISWAIAGGIGALAASFLAGTMSLLTTSEVGMMTTVQVQGFLASVLGGFSTFHGPVVAAFIITITRSFTDFYVSQYSLFIIYGLILAFVMIKPYGIFGKKVTKKV